MTMITSFDTEIDRLQQEASAIERAPPSFEEVWPAVEAGLSEAETTFRRVGPCLDPRATTLPEYVHQRHVAAIGAAMVANRKAVLDSERSRIKARTEGGISATDRQSRLDEIARAILRMAARRELELRKAERDGEFLPRAVHPELLVYKQADIERLAL